MLKSYLNRYLFMYKLQKTKILFLFFENIKGYKFDRIKNHCGSEGYWLEECFNIKHNSSNKPDIFNFELKKESNKITLGDFSASEYLFSKNRNTLININKLDIKLTRDEFIQYFGTIKNNRYSWSGKCVPIYNIFNECGQILTIDENNNILIYYSFIEDKRIIKENFPDYIKNKICIAYWSNLKLKKLINDKFNCNGFIICRKQNKIYTNISFGYPFNFYDFILNIKNKTIFFDSGMYIGNLRNYSQFRASGKEFWNKLIYQTY